MHTCNFIHQRSSAYGIKTILGSSQYRVTLVFSSSLSEQRRNKSRCRLVSQVGKVPVHLAGGSGSILSQTRRRCCLCSNNCKWSTLRVFPDKEIKMYTQSLYSIKGLKRTHALVEKSRVVIPVWLSVFFTEGIYGCFKYICECYC